MSLDNPYLDRWRACFPDGAGTEAAWAWFAGEISAAVARGDQPTDPRNDIRVRYAYSIPTTEAVAAIARLSPIVEIGAGTGYWAWMLRQAGAEVAAFDVAPPPPPGGVPEPGKLNEFHGPHPRWTDVLPGGAEQVSAMPARTLLLCWPALGNRMASDALALHGGVHLVYVGDRRLTATPAFFTGLELRYELERLIEIPRWPGSEDFVEIWRRRGASGTLSGD